MSFSVGIIFYGVNASLYFCFLRLARRWPSLMVEWWNVEQSLPEFRTQLLKANLARQIKLITLCMMMLSLSMRLVNVF